MVLIVWRQCLSLGLYVVGHQIRSREAGTVAFNGLGCITHNTPHRHYRRRGETSNGRDHQEPLERCQAIFAAVLSNKPSLCDPTVGDARRPTLTVLFTGQRRASHKPMTRTVD